MPKDLVCLSMCVFFIFLCSPFPNLRSEGLTFILLVLLVLLVLLLVPGPLLVLLLCSDRFFDLDRRLLQQVLVRCW